MPRITATANVKKIEAYDTTCAETFPVEPRNIFTSLNYNTLRIPSAGLTQVLVGSSHSGRPRWFFSETLLQLSLGGEWYSTIIRKRLLVNHSFGVPASHE